MPFRVSVVILEPLRCKFPVLTILLCLQYIIKSALPFYSCMRQPVHSLRAPSHALAIFSEENWEQLHNCAVLKVGLESQLAELLGGGLHVSDLVYVSSQLVYPALWASIFKHPSFTWMIQSLSSVKLMFTKWFLKLNSCPDFELLGKCYWYSLTNCIPVLHWDIMIAVEDQIKVTRERK